MKRMMMTMTTRRRRRRSDRIARPSNARICWAHGFCPHFFSPVDFGVVWKNHEKMPTKIAWIGQIVCMTHFSNQFYAKFFDSNAKRGKLTLKLFHFTEFISTQHNTRQKTSISCIWLHGCWLELYLCGWQNEHLISSMYINSCFSLDIRPY